MPSNVLNSPYINSGRLVRNRRCYLNLNTEEIMKKRKFFLTMKTVLLAFGLLSSMFSYGQTSTFIDYVGKELREPDKSIWLYTFRPEVFVPGTITPPIPANAYLRCNLYKIYEPGSLDQSTFQEMVESGKCVVLFSSEQDAIDAFLAVVNIYQENRNCPFVEQPTEVDAYYPDASDSPIEMFFNFSVLVKQTKRLSTSRVIPEIAIKCTEAFPGRISVATSPVIKDRFANCPEDTEIYGSPNYQAICIYDRDIDLCSGTGGTVGNPCSPVTGDKIESETDISANGSLIFERTYHSNRSFYNFGLGQGWSHTYSTRWVPPTIGSEYCNQNTCGNYRYGWYFEMGSGSRVVMRWNSRVSGYGPHWNGAVLTESGGEWILERSDGTLDVFDEEGKILRTEDDGQITQYTYNVDGTLRSVTDHFGFSLIFSYNASGNISSVTDTSGTTYLYEYYGDNNLVTVTYPDATDLDNFDNPQKQYHYEDSDFPNHLTGITDENGDRYSTYAYGPKGRVVLSEHAVTTNSQGQMHFEIEHHNNP